MISYSSSDIIKRSLNLADLTNSSFLSWGEKLQYLNTSWTNIYQKIIDAGEKDWLNTVYLVPGASTSYNGVKYSLPSDFYQIYSVSSFPNNSPILRRAKNEPYTSLRYDVINGELIIYGSICSNLQVQYYPLPQTLTFPADEKALGVDTTNTYYDCNNDSYLYISWSGGNLTVGYYSLLTGTSTTVATIPDTLNFPYKGLISGKNIMIWNSALSWAEQTNFYVIDISSGNYQLINGMVPLKGGEIYGYNPTSGDVLLYRYYNGSWTNLVVSNIGKNIIMTGSGAYENGAFAYFNGTSIIFGDTAYTGTFANSMPMRIINGILYWNDAYNNIYSGDTKLCSGENIIRTIGVNKADMSTGYGISYIGADGGIYIASTFIDTKLDFPNNIEFQLLAYDLARAYMIKQKADISLISIEYDKIMTQFVDMENRDINQNVRITNAYAYAL